MDDRGRHSRVCVRFRRDAARCGDLLQAPDGWRQRLMQRGRSSTRKLETIDDYLAGVDDDKRAALERLRKTIKAIIPRAEECISYQMPAFRLDGRVLVWFGAGANHCAFYPGGLVTDFEQELGDYEISKGTIRFQPDRPLPAALVRKLIKARIARDEASRAKKRVRRTRRR